MLKLFKAMKSVNTGVYSTSDSSEIKIKVLEFYYPNNIGISWIVLGFR